MKQARLKVEEERARVLQVKQKKKLNKGKEFKCTSCDMTFAGKVS